MAYKQTSISDVLNFLGRIQGSSQEKKTYRNYMFNEFTKGVTSFNNEEVQYNYDRMTNYYNDNVSKLSSEEIDMYALLKDKYDRQIEINNQFDVDNERRFSFGKEIYDFADEYSNANDARSFSYKKSTINDKGEMVDEDVIVSLPNPDDYFNGVDDEEFRYDNDEALTALGGVEGYTKKKEEYKKYLKNQAMKQIGAYSDYQGKMIKDYGGSGRLNQFHLGEFQELDESYDFIIDSLEDDGIFDSEERDVYKAAIMSKSSDPVRQFIAKDEEIKDLNRGVLLKEMQLLKVTGDTYADDLDSVLKSSLDMDAQQLLETAITIPENTQFNSGDTDRSYTYQDLKNLDNHPELAGYISSLQTNIENVKKELKKKDTNYMKNDGGSFLAGMEEETWTSDLHEIPQGHIPKIYGASTPSTTTTTTTTKSPVVTINIDKDVESVKSWASPKIKKTGERLNQIQLEIDNYEYEGYGSGNLRKLLGKKDEAPISYNELNQLEVSYNSDVKEMNILNAEYKKMIEFGIKKNDPRRINLEAKINQLYYKWTNTTWNRKSILGSLEEELKGGRFKFSQSTPFEALKFAKNKYLALINSHKRLETKYKKDLERAKK